MESKLMWVVIVVLFFSSLDCSNSCMEEERFALVNLQKYFISPYAFPTWAQESTDCCNWERVHCHNVTKRVVELHFGYFKYSYPDDRYLNASWFSSFKQLEVLILNGNSITGCVKNGGFDKLKNLPSLRYLDLSHNRIRWSFDALGLCELDQLQNLHLENNHLVGSLPWCLANFTSLQVLNINSNHFHGNISSSPLPSMTSIRSLNIGGNQFHIPISLKPFFNLSKLKILNATDNKFYVEPVTHSVPPKFQLEQVMLDGCRNFTKFPAFLYNQQALTTVNLQNFNLKDEFPNWLLMNNKGLRELHLQNNSLSGILRLQDPYLGVNLTSLDVSANLLQGHILADIATFLPNLVFLNVSNNAIDGNIPSSLADMKSLQTLDLSNNHLSGNIPEHLTTGCFALQFLSLSNNSLQGQIFSSKFNLTNLQRLLLDGNQFTGKIPDSLSNCSSLMQLSLSDNHFSGLIPGWLGNMSSLRHLIMAKNHLQGHIPIEFCQLNDLLVLDLSENNISGSLPSCFSPPFIQQVHLSKNRLQGDHRDAFMNSYELTTLDMSYNHINGSVPGVAFFMEMEMESGEDSNIYLYSDLSYLKMSHNDLDKGVPLHLCRLRNLQFLDLSNNKLSGRIPPCLFIDLRGSLHPNNFDKGTEIRSTSVRDVFDLEKENHVEIATKSLSYTYQGKILPYMAGIDLSSNKLTGEIPEAIGLSDGIRVLNLSHNELTGQLPTSFSNLNQLESLDLSYNNLNGSIPPEFVELNSLAVFSVAHNNLSGRLPDRTAQFITFGEDSYDGNPQLCGPPLPRSCDAIGTGRLPPPSVDSSRLIEFDKDIFYISFAVAYVCAFSVVVLVLYLNRHWRRRWFHLVQTCYYFIVDHLP